MTARVQDVTGRRMGVLIALVTFVPPLGMLFALRSSYTNTRAKVLFSLLSTISMTIFFTFLFGGRTGQVILPTPSVPRTAGYAAPSVAPAPPSAQAPAPITLNDGVIPANPLTNAGPGGSPNDPLTVYAVRDFATMYHMRDECDGQINRRSLTLAEAQSEGLTPCPKCVPPN